MIKNSENVNPLFLSKIEKFLELIKENNLKAEIFSLFRSFDFQKKLHNKYIFGNGFMAAKAGFSWHNYGLAVDIVFKDESNRWTWDLKNDWKLLGKLGKSLGLEWGGDWKRRDMAHFQMSAGLRVNDAYYAYQNGGLKSVWSLIEKNLEVKDEK